ncbi:hypothetical protein C2R22_08000 [Salinigranum rubrum]|uniref:Uncharacterized protein n=1 Tax=Salinigranum rubrum TaxID=755307 RepID=A0A2I8VI52_9EURY|nr:hypothetical protein [Salinigranum rubrum]AUV81601.1 hypothetical protein C2R22_08000 [Salinigranum rubrum]
MNDDAAGPAETTITRMGLRSGGWIGYDEESVFVQPDEEQGYKIARADIARITLNPVEWDLVVMSLLLVGIGGYVGFTRNPLVGVGFLAVGVWSVYRTYSNRYELVLYVDDQPKPVSVHPTHPKECHRTIGELIRSEGDEGEGRVEAT